MNNKGQSLVSFILLIPIILLILFMVYDIGNMVLLKIELNNINYLVIDYGLDKIDDSDIDNKLKEMINKNKSDIDNIEINIASDKINITLEDKLNSNISLIKNVVKIKSSYVGSIENGKKKIMKG